MKDLPPSAGRVITAVSLSRVSSILPSALLGGVAVFVQQDLGFAEGRLGLAVAAYFASYAITSIPAGRFGQRVGAWRALFMSAVVSGTAMLAIGILVTTWIQLLMGMIVGGFAQALCQPATNLAISEGVAEGVRGLAFGIKQGAVPAATVLAGVAVPALAVTVGWRWAFLIGALLSIPLAQLLHSTGEHERAAIAPARPGRGVTDAALITLAAGGALASAAANAMQPFYVGSATSQGLSPSLSGSLLAFGGLCGIVARVFWGWVADRRGKDFLLIVAFLQVAGSVGFLLFTTASNVTLIAGTFLAFGLAWGWPGLFHFAIVRHYPVAPAAATGVITTGLAVGGSLGPVIFGILVEAYSYETAWIWTAGLMAGSAGLMVRAQVLLLRRG